MSGLARARPSDPGVVHCSGVSGLAYRCQGSDPWASSVPAASVRLEQKRHFQTEGAANPRTGFSGIPYAARVQFLFFVFFSWPGGGRWTCWSVLSTVARVRLGSFGDVACYVYAHFVKQNSTRTSGRPQHTNVEDMHPAYRDMMSVQKDAQLLNWGKNNRNIEIAAVAAAEKLRSKVGSARNRDDGSKMSAAMAADCRCGRTGRALTRDGKRLREREQESSKDSKLNIRNTNRPDVSQRRAGGSGVCHPGTGDADAHTHGLRVGRKGNKRNDREGRNVKQKRTLRGLDADRRKNQISPNKMEMEHVPGHATEEMVMQGRVLQEHRMANNQADLLAKQKAASGGPPQALFQAYLERAETTRRHQEMAIEFLEERDHFEDSAPQAEQDTGVADEVRDLQKTNVLPSNGGGADGDGISGDGAITQKRFAIAQRWRRSVRGRPWPGETLGGGHFSQNEAAYGAERPFECLWRAQTTRAMFCARWRVEFFFCRSTHALASFGRLQRSNLLLPARFGVPPTACGHSSGFGRTRRAPPTWAAARRRKAQVARANRNDGGPGPVAHDAAPRRRARAAARAAAPQRRPWCVHC